jgi:hypothetical protein
MRKHLGIEPGAVVYRAAHVCKAKVLLTGDLRDFGFLMNAPELADGLLIQTVVDFLVAQA